MKRQVVFKLPFASLSLSSSFQLTTTPKVLTETDEQVLKSNQGRSRNYIVVILCKNYISMGRIIYSSPTNIMSSSVRHKSATNYSHYSRPPFIFCCLQYLVCWSSSKQFSRPSPLFFITRTQALHSCILGNNSVFDVLISVIWTLCCYIMWIVRFPHKIIPDRIVEWVAIIS